MLRTATSPYPYHHNSATKIATQPIIIAVHYFQQNDFFASSHPCIQTNAFQAVYFCTREQEVFDSLMAFGCRGCIVEDMVIFDSVVGMQRKIFR